MIYTTLTIPGDNNVYLREKNPHQKFIHSDHWFYGFGVVRKDWSEFEDTAIAAKKILINPVEGKTEYDSWELKEAWQYKTWDEHNWHISSDNRRLVHIGLESRQVFQYIGKKAKPEETVEQSPIISPLINAAKYGYEYHRSSQFPDLSFEENCRNNFLQFIDNRDYKSKFYTESEVLTILRNMKKLCVERLGQMPIVTHLTALKSILSINENELLK